MSRQSIGVANEAATLDERVVSISTGTTKLEPHKHANRVLLLTGVSASTTIDLPLATGSGDRYTFFNSAVKVASGQVVINATHGGTSNVIKGTVVSIDMSGAVVSAFTSTTNDIMTFNGTTTGFGDFAGDKVVLLDAAANTWWVEEATVFNTGSGATPFSG